MPGRSSARMGILTHITKRNFLKGALGAGLGALSMIESAVAGERTADAAKRESSGGKGEIVRIPDVSIRMRSPDSVLVGYPLRG